MLSRPSVILMAITSTILIGASAKMDPTTTIYTVPLSGRAETNVAHPTGGTGDMQASGSVKLAINPARKQVCYSFRLSGLSTPLMAHIHEGRALGIGPPVVTLFTGPGGNLDDCVTWTHSQLAEIVAKPSDYYVDIDTTEYPDGALRGQLAGT